MIGPALVFLRAFIDGMGWKGWLVLSLALALLAAVYMVRSADRDAGATRERARIEGANDAAGGKADAAEQRVLDCRGTWNRETSRCEP